MINFKIFQWNKKKQFFFLEDPGIWYLLEIVLPVQKKESCFLFLGGIFKWN